VIAVQSSSPLLSQRPATDFSSATRVVAHPARSATKKTYLLSMTTITPKGLHVITGYPARDFRRVAWALLFDFGPFADTSATNAQLSIRP
jgi:hypothetical protein